MARSILCIGRSTTGYIKPCCCYLMLTQITPPIAVVDQRSGTSSLYRTCCWQEHVHADDENTEESAHPHARSSQQQRQHRSSHCTSYSSFSSYGPTYGHRPDHIVPGCCR